MVNSNEVPIHSNAAPREKVIPKEIPNNSSTVKIPNTNSPKRVIQKVPGVNAPGVDKKIDTINKNKKFDKIETGVDASSSPIKKTFVDIK